MIFFKYIGRDFLKYYLITIFFSLGIFVLIDFIEKNPNYFVRYNADWWTITQYYLFSVPEQFILFSPLAVLLAVIITLILLSRNAEIVAMQSCGLSLFRITLPFLLLASLIFFVNLAIINLLVPFSSKALQRLDRTSIRKKSNSIDIMDKNWIKENNRFYNIQHLSRDKKTLSGISIFEFADGFNLKTRIDVKKAKWNQEKNTWDAFNISTSTFSKEGLVSTNFTPSRELHLPGKPTELTYIEQKPEQMGYSQLAKFIEKNTLEGIDVSQLEVELYLKIAYPFINIVMCILGIPFALIKERSGSMALGIVISIGIGMAYWVVLSICRTLGRTNDLHPFIGAWGANIIFLLLGIYLLKRINK